MFITQSHTLTHTHTETHTIYNIQSVNFILRNEIFINQTDTRRLDDNLL